MSRFGWIRPGWNPPTTVLMVIGFIAFWPVGLAVLAYILLGKRMRRRWHGKQPSSEAYQGGRRSARDHEELAERERLEAERQKLEDERRAFENAAQNMRKSSDAEEFERFTRARRGPQMAQSGSAQGSSSA